MVQGRITAESVKKSLHKIIDEAEVGGSGEQDNRPVNLAAWCIKQTKSNEPLSDALSYRIPGWGVVSFTPHIKDSLSIFRQFSREIIFGVSHDSNSNLAKRRTLGRGLSSVIRNLKATKDLAESLPHLPVVSTVSLPFEEAL